MLWLILGIFAALILCAWLEDETRQQDHQINRLVRQDKKHQALHKPNNIVWPY